MLGGVLRLFQIGVPSLWLDELLSVFYARGDWAQVLMSTAQGDTNPPLFNLFLHIALQYGSDETAVRAVSFLFSTATIPMLYIVARQWFDERVAFVAALMLALDSFHLLFAQEARMYALLAFLVLTAFFFFQRAWQSDRVQDWGLFGGWMALAFYTHNLAFLNLFALDVFALTQPNMLRKRWRGLLVAHIIIAVAFLPWLAILVQQVTRVQSSFWGMMPSPLSLLTVEYLFLFSNVLPIWSVPIALFVALAILVLAILAAIRRIRLDVADAPSLLFTLIIFLVPVLGLFALSLIRPIFVERTLLPASFGLYLLLAWTLACARPRALHLALGAMIIVGMLVALPNYYFNPDMQKPPMRQAAMTLVAQSQSKDGVAHTSDSSALAFEYYAPQLQNQFLAGDPDYLNETTRGRSGRIAGLEPVELNAIVSGHARLWLVVALDHNSDYQKSQVRRMDDMFKRLDHQTVGGIDLLLYEVNR
jgi:uncharacterized membrane protein